MIGKKIGKQVDDVARENFVTWLEAGNKLSFGQLKKLNSVWKSDYIGKIMKDSALMEEYLKEYVVLVQEQQDENFIVISNIEDMQDTWDDGMKDLQKAVIKKSDESGITKQLMYEFEEFDIQDMYMADGTFCYSCKKNLNCTKHAFGRQDGVKDGQLKLPFGRTKATAQKEHAEAKKNAETNRELEREANAVAANLKMEKVKSKMPGNKAPA